MTGGTPMISPMQPDVSHAHQAESSWPDAFDALVAAPAHHTLLFENERVRVLNTCIAPGDRTPLHTHRWPSALYIVSWSSFVRYDAQGTILLDSRTVRALVT